MMQNPTRSPGFKCAPHTGKGNGCTELHAPQGKEMFAKTEARTRFPVSHELPLAIHRNPAGLHDLKHTSRVEVETASSYFYQRQSKNTILSVVRKDRDVCRGNLSRVNTVTALLFVAF